MNSLAIQFAYKTFLAKQIKLTINMSFSALTSHCPPIYGCKCICNWIPFLPGQPVNPFTYIGFCKNNRETLSFSGRKLSEYTIFSKCGRPKSVGTNILRKKSRSFLICKRKMQN